MQRVYIGNKPISPAGFMASAPVFCDTPQGLLVVYTVGVGAGADIISTDTSGGSLRRLTQHEGANTYAACSPDGRQVAFFSTGKRGYGAGPVHHAHPAPLAREEDLQRGRRVTSLGVATAGERQLSPWARLRRPLDHPSVRPADLQRCSWFARRTLEHRESDGPARASATWRRS